MAQKTSIDYIDDIDGTPGAQFPNTEFALDGVTYEIDLNETNRRRLDDALREYIATARRTGGRRRSPAIGAVTGVVRQQIASSTKEELEKIRAWGRENGFPVSDRGRLSQVLQAAYHEAQAAPEEEKTARRKRTATKAKTAAFSA